MNQFLIDKFYLILLGKIFGGRICLIAASLKIAKTGTVALIPSANI